MLSWCLFLLLFPSRTHADDSCATCRDIAKTFVQEFERTSSKTFVGGNALWERTNIGNYASSETRFHDIFDQICVNTERKGCHKMLEVLEESLESWWNLKSNFDNVQLDLFETYLCINTGHCCSYGKFGPTCSPCLPCLAVGGSCDGNGTRSGTGICSCRDGYIGHLCDECNKETHFHLNTSDSIPLVCIKCHEACYGGCSGSKSNECVKCATGWTTNITSGDCVDVNECQSSPCASHEVCINTPGSYTCERCAHMCMECHGTSSNDCDTCAHGYKMNDGGLCVDVNECVELENMCTKSFERCQNAEGSYSCVCMDGYSRNGDHCVPKIPSGSQSKNSKTSKIQNSRVIWTVSFVKEFSKYLGALVAFCLFCFAARRHPFLICVAAAVLGFYIYFQSITLDRIFSLQL